MGSSRALQVLRILFAVEALALVAVRVPTAFVATPYDAFRVAVAEWLPVYLLGYLAWALRRREPHVYYLFAGTQALLVVLAVQAGALLLAGRSSPELVVGDALTPADLGLAAAVGPLHLALLVIFLRLELRLRFLVGLDPDLARIHAEGRVPLATLRLHRSLGLRDAKATLGRLHAAGGFVGAIDHERREVVSAAALAAERGVRCPGCAAVMAAGSDRCNACRRSLLVGESRRPLPAPVAVRVAATVTAFIAAHQLLSALFLIGATAWFSVVAASRFWSPDLILTAATLLAGLVLGAVAAGIALRRPWAHPSFVALASIAVLIDSGRIGADYYVGWSSFDFHPPASMMMGTLAVDLALLAVKIAGLVLLLRPHARAYLRRSLAGWARAELDRHGELTIDRLSSYLRLPPHRAAAVALDLAASEVDEAVLDFRRGALVELDRLSEDDEERHCTECGSPLAHLAVGRACGWCGAGDLSVHSTYRS